MGKLRPGGAKASLRSYNDEVHFPTVILNSFQLRLLPNEPSVACCPSLPAPSHGPQPTSLLPPLHADLAGCPTRGRGTPPHRSQRPPAPTVVDSTHRAVLRGTGKLRAPRPCPGCDGGIRQLLLPARAGVQETGDLGSARSSATEFLQICREITDFPGISPEV